MEHNRERPLVEILDFDGCPNHECARVLVQRVSEDRSSAPSIVTPGPSARITNGLPGAPEPVIGTCSR